MCSSASDFLQDETHPVMICLRDFQLMRAISAPFLRCHTRYPSEALVKYPPRSDCLAFLVFCRRTRGTSRHPRLHSTLNGFQTESQSECRPFLEPPLHMNRRYQTLLETPIFLATPASDPKANVRTRSARYLNAPLFSFRLKESFPAKLCRAFFASREPRSKSSLPFKKRESPQLAGRSSRAVV